MNGIFEFEKGFAAALACIPMSVRLKLDCSGVKISLAQWNRLSGEERRRALELRCESDEERAAFRTWLVGRVRERSGEAPGTLPVEPRPAWESTEQVPEALNAHLATRGLPRLSRAQWCALQPLQRFALLKMARPGHHDENLVAALREFGLPPA